MDALVRPFSTRNRSDEGVQVTFFNRQLTLPAEGREPEQEREVIADPFLKAKVEDSYRWTHNPDDTYYVFRAKEIPEFPAAKTKPTTTKP